MLSLSLTVVATLAPYANRLEKLAKVRAKRMQAYFTNTQRKVNRRRRHLPLSRRDVPRPRQDRHNGRHLEFAFGLEESDVQTAERA